MSTPKPRIAIVGLGLIGTSIGLALRQAEVASAVVGHDRERGASNEAKTRGAVDRVEWNLIAACEKSDLVILSIPLDGLEPTLQAIGPYLRPGCVVVDTAPLKSPVLAWAAQHLPPQVQFVGTNPILPAPAGSVAARADLFERGLFCIVPSPAADEPSIKLVSDLVAILGARPFFLDAAEHDGLLGGVDHLPLVLALALLEMSLGAPSWRELRKVAGPTFETGTYLGSDAQAVRLLLLANRGNLVRWIDSFTASLASVRQAIVGEEDEELGRRLEKAIQERQKWLADRGQGLWQEGTQAEMPPRPSLLDTFFGSFWRGKGSKREP